MSRGRRISRLKMIPPTPDTAKKYLLDWENRDLYKHLNNFPNLSRKNLFSLNGKMTLEIGCGTGEFLCLLAKENPKKSFLGVEVSRRAIYHAVDLANQQNLNNILFIKADLKLLYGLMMPDSWGIVYLHFPDPNYGKQHLKHRIVNETFLNAMYSSLGNVGKINIVTDQKPLLEDILNIFNADNRFSKTKSESLLKGEDLDVVSRFHKTWIRNEREIYQFEAVKN